jgi:radical SAM superfamily enzyme YgiQ (UPF0313 family)
MNKKTIYLINPKNPDNFWTMQGALDVVGKKALMFNAALLTLISLTPKDLDIDYVFCDENINPIQWDLECDLVAITGYTLQAERIKAISDYFRGKNIPVAIGGVFVTLNPDDIKSYANYLFIGEAEYTWPEFLRAWVQGKAAPIYNQQEPVNINDSPPPDLSYIKAKDYLYFAVQTSRGCPNNCDFCDVLRVAGRNYRSKSIQQIMAEVCNAQKQGAETVFFSDDNFCVNKKFTSELLCELIKFNTAISRPLSFSTQTTIQIGEDDKLLKLLADARFSVVFLGLESIRKECLEEVNKGQMVQYNAFDVIPRISSYGIMPFIGMIVGFDHDDKYVFEEIEKFLNETGSPIASISVLNAPKQTALYERMKHAGRLSEDFRGFWHCTTNIIPKQMTLEELYIGQRNLFRKLYEPEQFEKRIKTWMKNIKYFTPLYSSRKKDFFRIFMIIKILWHFTLKVPKKNRILFYRILKTAWHLNPRLISRAFSIMVQYWHYYYFTHITFWNNQDKNSIN